MNLYSKLILLTLKFYGPFLWMGFNCLKATATSGMQFTFYHSVPRNSWYSFYRPRKEERLSRPWSHPVVLNTEPLDWESSAWTTRPLMFSIKKLREKLLTHITPLVSFYTPWKHQNTKCFLMFSGSITENRWYKMT